MAATPSVVPPPSATGGADLEDSNVSSPLSEVDGKDDDDDELERMQLDGDTGDNSSLSDEEVNRQDNDDGSDSDSVLSEANSDINSDMNDTEAETERLYDTPQNPRQRDVLVDRYNDGLVFEYTPSRLRTIDKLDKAENSGDESLLSDNVSVTSSHGDMAESPVKHAVTQDTSVDEENKLESHERKRKRSLVADQSDSDQPLRKRTGSLGAPVGETGHDTPPNDDDTTPPEHPEESHSADEDGKSSPRKRETAEADAPTRGTRSGTKRKGAGEVEAVDEAVDEIAIEGHDGVPEEDLEQANEEAEADGEEEAEAAARNLEEMERKQAAFKDWTQIEEMFGVFRDRLYKDRLQRLEEEEQSLLRDDPTHPEYLNMKQCLDDRLGRTLGVVNKEYEFRITAHQKRAVAQRAQIWSQYFQAIREKREQALEGLNKEWYQVQTARRSAHSLPDYGLLFPKESSLRYRTAIAYNSEVSTLAGIAKYEGFPAAPSMAGASHTEIEDDLAAVKQTRRGRKKQQKSMQPREEYQPTTFNRLDPAGEQFLKNTPWANPNHSSHKLHHSGAALPEGLPEKPAIAGRPNQHGPSPSAPADPRTVVGESNAVQKAPAAKARPSEASESSRPMLTPATHQMKRAHNMPSMARGPKTAAV